MNWYNLSIRSRIGIAAGVLLAIAAVTYGMALFHVGQVKPFAASMKIGAPLFFLWLAWPDLAMFPRWVLQATIPITLLVAIYPKLLCFIVPLVFLMMFLQPKPPKASKSTQLTKYNKKGN